jgi:heme/copper-type cytochrome/quinol oxidase subunit 4
LANATTIEVRHGWKNYYLLGFAVFIIVTIIFISVPGMRITLNQFLFTEWTFPKMIALAVILSLPGICLFNYFNKSVELRIGEDGVWHKQKGSIRWLDIQEFQTSTAGQSEGDIDELIFTISENIKGQQKTITIQLRRVDMDFEEIRNCISAYLIIHQIKDLGHRKSFM